MKLLKTCGRAGLFLLALLVLSIPALAAGSAEDGAPMDWTEETDRTDYYEVAPAARAALTRLDAPTELEWGEEYVWDDGAYRPGKAPGMLSWRLGDIRLNTYRVCIYRRTEAGEVLVDRVDGWNAAGVELEDGSRRDACYRFLLEDRESGEYFFTVQAMGDGKNYADSNTAYSRTWYYEKPADRLTAPERPAYGGSRSFSWTAPQGAAAYANRVQIEILFAPDQDAEPSYATSSIRTYSGETEQSYELWDTITEKFGTGWYSIRVRLLSRDITAMDSSLWSARSEPVYFRTGNQELEDIAGGVTENDGEQEKREALEAARELFKTSPDAVISGLMEDRDGSGAAGSVRRLETALGNGTRVVLTGGLENAFEESRISVVGAGLNVEVGGTAVLTFSPPEMKTVLPEAYTGAVEFSLRLENEAGQDASEWGFMRFPFRVTLPAPQGMDPKALVLFQCTEYEGVGSYQEMRSPYMIWQENGRWMAAFAVDYAGEDTAFALAERRLNVEQRPGGVDVSVKPDGTPCFCALYDAGGRMLEVQGGSGGPLRFDAAGAARGAVFRLDGEFRPVGEAWSFQLEEE